jgi:hypothetical protein
VTYLKFFNKHLMAISYADSHFVCIFSESDTTIYTNHSTNSRLLMCKVVQAWDLHRPTLFPIKTRYPFIALRSAQTVLPVRLVKQLKCLCKFYEVCSKISHTRSSSSFIVTLPLI